MTKKYRVILMHRLRDEDPTKVTNCGDYLSMGAAVRRARQLLDHGIPSHLIDILYQSPYDELWHPLFTEGNIDHRLIT